MIEYPDDYGVGKITYTGTGQAYPRTGMETALDKVESHMSRELNILSKATSELCMQIEQLENRLYPILTEQPKLAGGNETPEAQLTQIPTEIRRHRYSIDQANYALRSILSRLEL